ncbi:MAG: hypothetical protein RR956_04740 [Christensenella sp.]
MTEQTKKNKTLLIILIVAVIAVLLVLLYALVLKPAEQNAITAAQDEELQKEENASLGILPGMSDEEVQDRINRVVADSMLNVSMNVEPSFQNGTAQGSLNIENIPGNKYSFIVEITREDNGEVIYKSGLIDPGYYVQYAKLDKVLPQGEYPCSAKFTAYNQETKKEVGTAGMQIRLSVLG